MKNCKECKNYMYLWDGNKFSHYCREYPNFKVMGSLEGLMINDKCSKYVAKKSNDMRSLTLKEKTLKRAGGSYEDQLKKAKAAREEFKRLEEAKKSEHVCVICLKVIPKNMKYCEECTPKKIDRRRELSRIRYSQKKG